MDMRINPNLCQKGKSRGVLFRTGAHVDRKKDKRHLRRVEKSALRDC